MLLARMPAQRAARPLPNNVSSLCCVRCGRHSTEFWEWTCRDCGPEGRMDVRYQPLAAGLMANRLNGRAWDQWRYRELLPLPDGARLPPLTVGGSPLSEAPRLAQHLGVRRVVVKDDGRNPSASLKDRASAIGVVLAVAVGAERIACASTGNAASSCACIAASMGLPATIFVPRRAPLPKVAQLRMFGAQVFRVDADYDTTWELAAQVTARHGWFDRNAAVNPYLVEGKKTVALELAEQLGPNGADWVAVSVGDGCTLAGVVKGLEEAVSAGLLRQVPRVLAVQARGAAPLVHAAQQGRPFAPEPAETVADSICVGHPRNADKALLAMARNGGAWIEVDDRDILAAMSDLAQLAGVFAEPAGATGGAGVAAAVAQGIIDPTATVAILVTGNGLKDIDTAIKMVTPPIDVAADVAAVERALLAADGN
jgi:threonine synthase